jgi:hypothetical protein
MFFILFVIPLGKKVFYFCFQAFSFLSAIAFLIDGIVQLPELRG